MKRTIAVTLRVRTHSATRHSRKSTKVVAPRIPPSSSTAVGRNPFSAGAVNSVAFLTKYSVFATWKPMP